ncbi:MAG: DUF1464 family protein [Desulfurococcales archaeon]|nr:DUF1464 family protein [Desulfurococcales archaeon]
MARVLGVDPGTGSMDILALDDSSMRVILEESIPRDMVTRDPGIVLRVVEEALPLDAVVAPSGYGLPTVRAQEASAGQIREATFIHAADEERGLRIVGLRRLMEMFRESSLPAWFTPGVIHLPTVPSHRKAGRIDMGTADKVFTVAAALRQEVEDHGVEPGRARFIAVEAGMAYTAAIAVDSGMIVDGIGGTTGWWGFMGMGFMDAELAYALAHVKPSFSKSLLFTGGASTITGYKTPQELGEAYRRGDPRARAGVEMLVEAVKKDVASLLAVIGPVERVYVSGRLFRDETLGPLLVGGLEDMGASLGLGYRVVRVKSLGARTKEAATGAALIASGLAGGRYKWLVDSLRLREASGGVFTHIHPKELGMELRRAFTGGSPL